MLAVTALAPSDVLRAIQHVRQEGERPESRQARLARGQQRVDGLANPGFECGTSLPAADGIGLDRWAEPDVDSLAEPQVGAADDRAWQDRNPR